MSGVALKKEEEVQSVESEKPAENAVEVRNITVSFRTYNERPGTLKEHIINFFRRGRVKYYSTFDALKDVSFSVKKGEIVGIIGSNGAGKSTLLKVLSGILKPASGEVALNGKVDSLISLGAGFDKELNAVENIYLYGSLHRLSKKEIAERVPRILEFAELEEFKNTPIRYYSSGMYARLGFACAIDMNPEILLVDEVLAVGDERFRQKCYEVMEELLFKGKTIVMVTHNIPLIELKAHRIGLLSKGKLIFYGDPKEAVKMYRDASYQSALDGNRM